MANYDAATVNAQILSQCAGQQKCMTSISQDLIKIPDEFRTEYNLFFFAQATCEQDPDELAFKNQIGLVVSCITIYIALIFRIYMSYYKEKDLINENLYSLNLVTIKSYSLMVKLNTQIYDRFMMTHFSVD